MIATATNLIYAIAGAVGLKRKQYLISVSLIILAVASGVYHYGVFTGNPSEFWQDADVSSIYLVLGALPFTFVGKKRSLIWMIPAIALTAFKFDLIEVPIDSTVAVPLMALPGLISGYFNINPDFYWSAVIFMVFALIFSFIANKFSMTLTGYDVPHGYWHLASGVAFIFLLMGMDKKRPLVRN